LLRENATRRRSWIESNRAARGGTARRDIGTRCGTRPHDRDGRILDGFSNRTLTKDSCANWRSGIFIRPIDSRTSRDIESILKTVDRIVPNRRYVRVCLFPLAKSK
jgi:hypothetical protein